MVMWPCGKLAGLFGFSLWGEITRSYSTLISTQKSTPLNFTSEERGRWRPGEASQRREFGCTDWGLLLVTSRVKRNSQERLPIQSTGVQRVLSTHIKPSALTGFYSHKFTGGASHLVPQGGKLRHREVGMALPPYLVKRYNVDLNSRFFGSKACVLCILLTHA